MHTLINFPEEGRPLIQDLIDDIKKSGKSELFRDYRKYLEKLAKFGLDINKKFKKDAFKRLDKNMYELRPNNFRIIFTKKGDVFYILQGFLKKSKKTPKKEINKAKSYIKSIFADDKL